MTAHSGQRHPWWLLPCRWCTVRHITVASPVCTPFNKLMLSTNKSDHTHLQASLWSQLHACKVSVTHLAQLWYYHIDSAHRQTRRINKYSKPLLWYFLPQRMSPDWSQPEFPVIKRQTNSCKEFDFIWFIQMICTEFSASTRYSCMHLSCFKIQKAYVHKFECSWQCSI